MSRRSGSRDGLAKLASHNYVSENGLAAVLKAIKDNPEMLEACSRSTLKRAREESVAIKTPYGTLLRRLTIPYLDDSVGLEFTYIDPIATLSHAIQSCSAFGQNFNRVHAMNPSSLHNPWTIILYTDEIQFGDPLSPHSRSRKVQGLYWSVLELGPELLACDDCWFVLTLIRSKVIEPIGGLTVLTRHMLDTFYERGRNVKHGIKIGNNLLFLDVGCIVQDYDAMKNMMQSKGRFCMATQLDQVT